MPETGEIVPEVTAQERPQTDYLAKIAQFTADWLCNTRPLQAAVIGKEIIDSPDYHSWKLAGKVALAGVLDLVDGRLSRWAAKREGRETTPEGARRDEIADKSMTHILLGSIATRSIMNQDYAFGSFILASQSVIAGRDILVTAKRNEAQKFGVDVKAQKLGKYKTGLQNFTLAAMCSPWAKSKRGKKAIYSLQTMGTGWSVASGNSLIKSLDEGITEERLKMLAV